MKKTTLVWLIVAAALIVVGLVIFCIGMTFVNWDFTKLSTATYVTNEYEITEDYNNISIAVGTADVIFLPSDSGTTKVSCYENETEQHSVKVVNGTLTVNVEKNNKKWYQYISFNGGSESVRIYLPNAEYEALVFKGSTGKLELPNTLSFNSIDASVSTGKISCNSSVAELLKVKVSTGKISIDGISVGRLDASASAGDISLSNVNCAGDISIAVSTGDVVLKSVRCNSLNHSGSTGDFDLNDVIALEGFNFKLGTGDVDMTECDAGEIYIKTGTGDVSGILLSDKIYVVNTNTGKVNVPNSVNGGRCEITTTTGDVKITVKK